MRLGVTTEASGISTRRHLMNGVLVEQPVAALRDHHGVDDQPREAPRRAMTSATARTIGGGRQHAGFRGGDRDVVGDRLDLRDDEVRLERRGRR